MRENFYDAINFREAIDFAYTKNFSKRRIPKKIVMPSLMFKVLSNKANNMNTTEFRKYSVVCTLDEFFGTRKKTKSFQTNDRHTKCYQNLRTCRNTKGSSPLRLQALRRALTLDNPALLKYYHPSVLFSTNSVRATVGAASIEKFVSQE